MIIKNIIKIDITIQLPKNTELMNIKIRNIFWKSENQIPI